MKNNNPNSKILNKIKVHYGFKSDAEFAKHIGVRPNTFCNWHARNTMDFSKILEACPEIDANWLMTGKGEMLKKDLSKDDENQNNYPTLDLGGIPLVNATAIGGFSGNVNAIEDYDIKAHYLIPKFDSFKADFMIEVEGMSMYPRFQPGDIVACKMISENAFIQWGRVYVVATKEQGIIIKRIQKGAEKEYLEMVSENPQYESFQVHRSEIESIALVIGSIKIEVQ